MHKRGIVSKRAESAQLQRSRTMRREMTPAERCLWSALRGNQCGGFHFRRQQIIDGFIADFYCHQAALVVEVDGGVHEDQADYDALRDQIISARGLLVFRCSNEEVFQHLPSLLLRIELLAANRTAMP